MLPSEKDIAEIAEMLDMGFRCFFNLRSGEIKSIPDFNNMIYADRSMYEEELEEIDENWDDYYVFEPMDSSTSFQIMVDFTECVDNKSVQNWVKEKIADNIEVFIS